MIPPSDLEDRRIRPADSDLVSPSEFASALGVSPAPIWRDIRKGALPALRLPSGRLRIRHVDAFRYGRPVDGT